MARLSDSEKDFVSSQLTEANSAADTAAGPEAQGAHLIDARGVSPPLPLLRAHRALRAVQPGQLVKVITSTQQSLREFQALVKFVAGYELVSQTERNGEYVHLLRRRR